MKRPAREGASPAAPPARPLVRLQKILSSAGVASRRAAEALLLQGRVSVNGTAVRALGTRADPDRDDIRLDGRRVRPLRTFRYILLNKPTGVVTTRADPEGRRTVIDLLPRDLAHLYPVGRLDCASEGLLLLTNDGDLAARLTHPRHEVPKTYHAVVRGVPSAEATGRLARGVVIDGRRTAPAGARVVKTFVTRGRLEALLEIVLREGRNRQVRLMCEAVGHPVERLRRIRIGPIADARLAPGVWRDLTSAEVASLVRATEPQPQGVGDPGVRRHGQTVRPREAPVESSLPRRGRLKPARRRRD
jgi:23S rRNA pseudouridine2605 synthase